MAHTPADTDQQQQRLLAHTFADLVRADCGLLPDGSYTITAEEMAARVGVHRNTILLWRSGARLPNNFLAACYADANGHHSAEVLELVACERERHEQGGNGRR